jgi:glutamyl-tRNA reductase
VLVVGLSHRSAPVDVLEKAVVAAQDVPKLLDEVLRGSHVSEAVVLSTCNRVEVYAVVDAFHGGLTEISAVLAHRAGMDLAQLTDHLYVHYAASAVEHLFAVAAGLDSMVVGETQILGQLRGAYAVAADAGTAGRVLHELSQQALRVGKRVHTETGVAAAGASLVTEALAVAAVPLDGLTGKVALLVGAGSMGSLAAAHLRRAGVAELMVANRTAERAERLAAIAVAAGTPARAIELDELAAELPDADLLVACTGAVGTVVGHAAVAGATDQRDGRPLAVCDLGLPRDVEPSIGELPGVTLVDLAVLQQRLRQRPGGADEGPVQAARAIVAAEVAAYLSAQRSAEVTPTVTALRQRASEVVDAELLRLSARLPELDRRTRDELGRTVRRVVDKLLHAPTVRVRQLADGPNGDAYAEALRELFELDPQAPAAVIAPRTAVSEERAEPAESAEPGDVR